MLHCNFSCTHVRDQVVYISVAGVGGRGGVWLNRSVWLPCHSLEEVSASSGVLLSMWSAGITECCKGAGGPPQLRGEVEEGRTVDCRKAGGGGGRLMFC